MIFAQLRVKGDLMKMNRRDFFVSSFTKGISKLSTEVFKGVNGIVDGIEETLAHYCQPSDLTDFDIFFLSSSYSSTLDKIPYQELVEQAKIIGLEPENKSKLELIREMFEVEERRTINEGKSKQGGDP
jgi:hypothetical protein